MSSDPQPTELERIKHDAAAWVVARERGLTGDEQDRFFEWLAADARHSDTFVHQQQVVHSLRKLTHWRPEHSTLPNPDLLAAPARKARGTIFHWPASRLSDLKSPAGSKWAVTLGLAAALVLAAVLWRQAEIPATTAPQIVRKVLEDGSTIDLNHGASVEVSYTTERRDVRLLSGEATFKVARNPDRPFAVAAAGVTVRAVGTAFNVNLQSQSVTVLVTEGRVQLVRPDSPTLALPELPLLEAGQRAVVDLLSTETPAIEAVAPAEMARVLAWQPRQLEFNDTPLAQVAVEFNTDNRVKLVIDDPVLAAMPLGASLRSDNVEGFVRILESNFGVKAERRGDMIILRRAP